MVDGRLIERRTSRRASRVAGRVLARLACECERTGEAEIYAGDLGYQCFRGRPDLVRRATMTIVRRERLADLPIVDPEHMPIAADLAVEVVAPSQLEYELVEKVRDLLTGGFAAVWVIHPNVRTVTVYRAGNAHPVTLGIADEITAEPALTLFHCPVAAFFE